MAERWWRLRQRLAGRGFYGDGYGWWDRLWSRLAFWKKDPELWTAEQIEEIHRKAKEMADTLRRMDAED